MDTRFLTTMACVDAENRRDPHTVLVEGEKRPWELFYAERLTAWVKRLDPHASDELLLASRAMHICRWTIPRDTFPKGTAGYYAWREACREFHAGKMGEIMRENGYGDDTISTVQRLIRKDDFPGDPRAQTLEDGLCLMFLEQQFDDMAAKADDEAIVHILRRTWQKMSEQAQAAALRLPYSSRCKKLIDTALGRG